MTPQEAYKLFIKKHGNLTVTECIDYGKYYVFVAVEDPEKVDISDPYYAVDKKTGEVGYFSPAGDIEKWVAACVNNGCDWK